MAEKRVPPAACTGRGRAGNAGANAQGFTLLEILIVVTILGILAGVAAVKIMDRPGEARRLKARMDIQGLENALRLYRLDNYRYPTTAQGLGAIVEKPGTGEIPANWRAGGYLDQDRVPQDPWGNPYLFLSPGVHNSSFDLWSFGADGEEGGSGENADVTNWVSNEK
jgi:general secretion pathway protein G